MAQRAVVIDDNDSGIIYTGSWFRDHGTYNTLGNYGAPFLNTLHGTNTSGSLLIHFVGSQVSVTTTLQFANPTGLSVQCLVDNENLIVIPNNDPENNLQLCTQDGLSDGPHVLTIIANVTNQETFWFDYLSYIPSSSVSLADATLSIDSTDSQVQLGFGTGWTTFSPGYETRQTSSKFHFDFNGVSLIWYGFYDPGLPWDTSLNTATYSIDGSTPIPFNTSVNSASVTTQPAGVLFNQVLFQTADYAAGSHTLEVIYQGSDATTPLTCQFIVVRATPASPVAASIGSTASTPFELSAISTQTSLVTAIATSSAHGAIMTARMLLNAHKPSHTGTIVGILVGVFSFLAVSAILLQYHRRRRKSLEDEKAIIFTPSHIFDSYRPPLYPSTVIGTGQHSSTSGTNQLTAAAPISSSSTRAFSSNLYDTPLFASESLQISPRQLHLSLPSVNVLFHSPPIEPPPPPVSRQGVILDSGMPQLVSIQVELDSGIRLDSICSEAMSPVDTLPPAYTPR